MAVPHVYDPTLKIICCSNARPLVLVAVKCISVLVFLMKNYKKKTTALGCVSPYKILIKSIIHSIICSVNKVGVSSVPVRDGEDAEIRKP